jgi:hypothetical protein
VTDIDWVDVFHGFHNLLEQPSALALAYSPLAVAILHVLLQADSIDELHDQINSLLILNQLHQSHDIGMLQLPQDSYLPLDCFPLHLVIQSVLVVDLQSVLLIWILLSD